MNPISPDVLRVSMVKITSNMEELLTIIPGFWSAKEEFLIRTKRDSTQLLSLSSLKRAWNEYLSLLEIPSEGFVCSICGQFPAAIITDCITLGTRSDLASFDVPTSINVCYHTRKHSTIAHIRYSTHPILDSTERWG